MNEVDLSVFSKMSTAVGLGYPMPENFKNRSVCFRFFWKFYVNFAYLLMVTELLSQAIQITKSFRSVEILLICLLSAIYVLQFLCKIIVLKAKESQFNSVFCEMTEISKALLNNPVNDKNFMKFYEEYYTKTLRFGFWKGILQLACNLCLNLLFIILSWTETKRQITTGYSWTPFDSSVNPNYTFTCIFEMLCFGFVTARTAVIDLLFWEMIIIPAVHLKYLRHLLKVVMKDETEIKSIHLGDHAVDNFETRFFEQTLGRRFQWWIKNHQRVLRMMENFSDLGSSFLAVSFISGLINLFLSGFIAISTSEWDILQRILINAVILADVFQLYVISRAGDKLRDHSEGVGLDVDSIALFKMNWRIRQNFSLIFLRTCRPIRIRFGGIYPLSSQTFSKLLQLTISYFVTIFQLKK